MKAVFIYSTDPSSSLDSTTRTTVYVEDDHYTTPHWHFDAASRMCTVWKHGAIELQVAQVFMVRVDNNYQPPQPSENHSKPGDTE